MHYACSSGNLHIIKSLLHRGAFVRVQNKGGKVPLDLAKESNYKECVSFLESIIGMINMILIVLIIIIILITIIVIVIVIVIVINHHYHV